MSRKEGGRNERITGSDAADLHVLRVSDVSKEE